MTGKATALPDDACDHFHALVFMHADYKIDYGEFSGGVRHGEVELPAPCGNCSCCQESLWDDLMWVWNMLAGILDIQVKRNETINVALAFEWVEGC